MTKTGGQTRGFGSTLAWTAPERWRNGKLTSKCDVYSFGIIVWEIAAATYGSVGSGDDDESTVTRPWEGVHPEHVKVKVSYNVLNPRLCRGYYNMIMHVFCRYWAESDRSFPRGATASTER